jgi:hypothetical protein
MDALLRPRLLGGPWPGAQEESAGRASARGRDDSGVHARQAGHGDGTVRLGCGGAGGGGAEVRLLRLGRAE